MNNSNELIKLIEESDKIGIVGHIRPDGDCVGSTLGFYNYIRDNYPEKKVCVYLEEFSKDFMFLSGADKVKHEPDGEVYDLGVSIDCADTERHGRNGEIFKKAKKTVCIDHHISNKGFGEVNVIKPELSSASELLYTLLEKEKITAEAAEAIYTGIVHDTGVFQYSCTSPQTMRIAAELMEMGINFSRIIDKSFYEKSYVQNQILGRCLMESILIMGGKVIVGYIRKRDMEFYGVEPKDLDGIVQQLRVTKGVEVAIFIYEVKTQEFKVSLRSNGDVDVNAVASYFSGGGHVKAAGCTMQGSVYDVINNLTRPIAKQLKERSQTS